MCTDNITDKNLHRMVNNIYQDKEEYKIVNSSDSYTDTDTPPTIDILIQDKDRLIEGIDIFDPNKYLYIIDCFL